MSDELPWFNFDEWFKVDMAKLKPTDGFRVNVTESSKPGETLVTVLFNYDGKTYIADQLSSAVSPDQLERNLIMYEALAAYMNSGGAPQMLRPKSSGVDYGDWEFIKHDVRTDTFEFRNRKTNRYTVWKLDEYVDYDLAEEDYNRDFLEAP